MAGYVRKRKVVCYIHDFTKPKLPEPDKTNPKKTTKKINI